VALSVAGTEVWGFAVRVWIYGNGNCENAPGRTAPGPSAGAGLPALAIGLGVYCLAIRRRKVNEKSSQVRFAFTARAL
jgi:hypothetical protein